MRNKQQQYNVTFKEQLMKIFGNISPQSRCQDYTFCSCSPHSLLPLIWHHGIWALYNEFPVTLILHKRLYKTQAENTISLTNKTPIWKIVIFLFLWMETLWFVTSWNTQCSIRFLIPATKYFHSVSGTINDYVINTQIRSRISDNFSYWLFP